MHGLSEVSALDSGAALRAGYVVWTTVSNSEPGMSGEQATPERTNRMTEKLGSGLGVQRSSPTSRWLAMVSYRQLIWSRTSGDIFPLFLVSASG